MTGISIVAAVGCAAAAEPSQSISDRSQRKAINSSTVAYHSPLSMGMPLPPQLPCRFPDNASDLYDLRAASDLVAVARVGSTVSQGVGKHTLSRVAVTAAAENRLPQVPEALTVIIPGSSSNVLKESGRYVLFLSQDGTAFGLNGGMRGAFAIDGADHVSLKCPNYVSPDKPIPAVGNSAGIELTSFLSWFKDSPRPARVTEQ
jgi:hypothetical protein